MLTYLLYILLLIYAVFPRPSHDPCVLHLESPTYHHLARAARLQGEVKVQVSVAPDGRVISVHATSGHKLLRQEAEANVRRWIFSSGADRTFDVLYDFRLEEPEVNYDPPARVSFDLPYKVSVISNFSRPDHH